MSLWLQPGWNFVGWLGADGSVDDLFDQADASPSAMAAVLAAAPANPAAAAVTWEPLARGAGRLIRTGEPLWIWIAGESAVLWQQDALRDPPVAALGAGRHAVVWAWTGERPIGAVLGRVAGQLATAQRWNPRTQAFDRYAADGDSEESWTFPVRRGEALYQQLAAPAVWGPRRARRSPTRPGCRSATNGPSSRPWPKSTLISRAGSGSRPTRSRCTCRSSPFSASPVPSWLAVTPRGRWRVPCRRGRGG